jgi:UDP-glucose 4-epimerase
MRVLVTGGSGALGSEVCSRLTSDGHEPIAYDLAPPQDAATEWFRGDTRDGVVLIEAIRTHDVAAVVHLASLLTLEAKANPRLAVEINSVGMVNALDAARILGVRRFVWASTAGVFAAGAGPGTIANDAPYRPLDIYGGTKILNETLADHYHHAYGLETIGLRFPVMTGAGQPTSLVGKLRTALVEKPVAGEPSLVPFADDIPNWLWIGDAARAIALATMSSSAPAGNYNVGGDVRSLRDAIAIVQKLVPGASIEAEPGIVGMELRVDASLFEERFGFRHEWPLEDQLAELVRRELAGRK